MVKNFFKGAFLDRDGVLNEDLNYIYERRKFIFKKGIFKLLRILCKEKFLIFIITNQSGIARGMYSEVEYQNLTKYYLHILKQSGISIRKVYHCPHHPDFSNPPFDNCECRKPKPGLFFKAKNEYNLDMQNSFMLGDSIRDLQAAYLSGINKRILLSDKIVNSKFITHRYRNVPDFTKNLSKIIS